MFALNEENLVFTYWEGPRIPYIELCYETMKKYCPNLVRLDETNAHRYVDLPDEYYKIEAINHRVDYLKAKLLHKYGGFWLDADTIVLKPLPFELLKEKDYIGCPGLFGAQKGSKTLEKWIKHMDVVIKKKQKFLWAELILPVVYENNVHNEVRGIDRKCIAPFLGERVLWIFFTTATELEKYDLSPTFAVALYNKVFPGWFKKMTEKEILESDYVISELFRKALFNNVSLPEFVTNDNIAGCIDRINQVVAYIRAEHQNKVWKNKYLL